MNNFLVSNVDYFMSCLNMATYKELADDIDANVSTLKSLLAKPTSNSKLKSLLAKRFGITVYQLDNVDFTLKNDKEETVNFGIDNDIPIIDMDKLEIYSLLLENDDFDDEETIQLKHKINKKYNIKYYCLVSKVKQEYYSQNFDKALVTFYNGLLNLENDELILIGKTELMVFIDLCEKLNSDVMLDHLVSRFTSGDNINLSILAVLYSLLKEKHINLAKNCLKSLVENNS